MVRRVLPTSVFAPKIWVTRRLGKRRGMLSEWTALGPFWGEVLERWWRLVGAMSLVQA